MVSSTKSSLCRTFCTRANWTWNFQRDGIRTGINPNEETITDLNLIRIQARHPKEVKTHKFCPFDEGTKSGADWDWWFGSRSRWLGLRIQAKKLDSQKLQYEKLDHVTTNHGLQVDLLRKSAINHRPKLVPMYCFYNYWSANISVQWNCGVCPPAQKLQGCTIASADYVKSLVSANDRSLKSVMKRCLPWSCLVCCQSYSGSDSDLTTRASSVLQKFFEVRPEIVQEPPPYVRDILNGEITDHLDSEVPAVLIVTEGIR